ncbi:unnamed protein product [Ectocarpus sp. CCAP 1310/34]|nr:unnamed protein product [Ectocarpus sp. CCAP 1310/34]
MSEPKAQKCFYLGPGINTNNSCVRILNEKRQAITTRKFTWQSVPAAPTALPQSLHPIAEEEQEFATGEDEVGEAASSHGGGRAEREPVDGGRSFNLGTTAAPAAPGPAGPPAPQVLGAGDAGDGAPSSREGARVAPSTTSAGMADVGGGEDDRRSSSRRANGSSGSGSGSGSDSDSETDLPAARPLRQAGGTHQPPHQGEPSPKPEVPPSPASAEALFASAASLPVSSTEEFTSWILSAAYTHATLEGEVFLRLPAGCGDKSHKIVKAERAIRGLKQSGRQWGYHAADTLVENGFEQCKADPCVFRKMVDEVVVMIIVVYLDDILVAGSDEDCKGLLASLNKKFPTKNLGECERFDGCAIERDVESTTLKISQTAITWVSTCSRPDVSFAVRAVERHAHALAKRHWDAIRKVLSYLKETRDLGITYQRRSGLGMAVYVNASYVDTEDNRSVSGLATTVGGTVVSHGSKTQSIVSLSSTEAEYIAGGEGVKEALFVRAVLSFVAPETRGSNIQVLEDNQGAIALVQNPLSSGRTNHIDVRFHFIRGLFSSGDISVKFVPTTDDCACQMVSHCPKNDTLSARSQSQWI